MDTAPHFRARARPTAPSHSEMHAVHGAHRPFQPVPGKRAAIAVGLADVRRGPDAASEMVTQARIWTPAHCLQVAAGWVRLRLPDYEGWVRASEVGAPGHPTRWVVVVTDHDTTVYAGAEGETPLVGTYVATVLPLARAQPSARGTRIPVRLPGQRIGWVARSAVVVRPGEQPFPPAGPPAALSLAHSLLGVPYLWGGTSPRGIDCSGFVQLCYRVAGATLLRDADQQYASIPYLVARGDLRPGDLLFFAAHGAIDHVALSLGGDRLIHATGSVMRVAINSLDPAASDYSALLARMYAGARRPMPDVLDVHAASTPHDEEAP